MVAVSRMCRAARLPQRRARDRVTTVVADVADPVVAGTLIEQYRPDTLVLNAGAAPLLRALHQHTWETFSRNWDVDVRHAFHWVREALLLPLPPGSTVVTISSGAAVEGHRSAADTPGQGHHPVPHGLRRRRVRPGGARHPFRLGVAEADAGDRARLDGGGGLPRRDGIDVDEHPRSAWPRTDARGSR